MAKIVDPWSTTMPKIKLRLPQTDLLATCAKL